MRTHLFLVVQTGPMQWRVPIFILGFGILRDRGVSHTSGGVLACKKPALISHSDAHVCVIVCSKEMQSNAWVCMAVAKHERLSDLPQRGLSHTDDWVTAVPGAISPHKRLCVVNTSFSTVALL